MTHYKIIGNLSALATEYVCLAFDLGRAQTGIAVGSSITRAGQILPAIPMHKFHPESWDHITQLLVNWQVDLCIVGDPIDTPNTAKKMHGFAKSLHNISNLPIVLVDESYTTVTAKNKLQESGQNRSNKAIIDSTSALLLIDHWFTFV